MNQKVIVQTYEHLIEGECISIEGDKIIIINFTYMNKEDEEEERFGYSITIKMNDIKRLFVFDACKGSIKSEMLPASEFSIAISGCDLIKKTKLVKISYADFRSIQEKLVRTEINKPIDDLEGIKMIAISYEVNNQTLTKLNIDTGKQIYHFESQFINLNQFRSICENRSIVKIVHNGRVLNSCLQPNFHLENLFDVMIADIMIKAQSSGQVPRGMLTMERVCQEYLGLPWIMFQEKSNVGFLFSVYQNQKTILMEPFEKASRLYQHLVIDADNQLASEYIAAPWLVPDQLALRK